MTPKNWNAQLTNSEYLSTKHGQKIPRNRKSPSTPNNGGQRNVVILSITIERQEVSKIGRNSRR